MRVLSRALPRLPGLLLAALLGALLGPGPADAAAALERAGGGVVTQVVDGDTLVLDDGTEVRLVGIQAPKLALGRVGFRLDAHDRLALGIVFGG